jgi:hypothetical protein
MTFGEMVFRLNGSHIIRPNRAIRLIAQKLVSAHQRAERYLSDSEFQSFEVQKIKLARQTSLSSTFAVMVLALYYKKKKNYLTFCLSRSVASGCLTIIVPHLLPRPYNQG